jgi:CMP-2-keto-3-deoxyoctulosonic acid synthetase
VRAVGVIPARYAASHFSGKPGVRVLPYVGIDACRRDFLLEFVARPRPEFVCSERFEQLRALEHAPAIRVAGVDGGRSVPMDVPDIAFVEAALREAGRC